MIGSCPRMGSSGEILTDVRIDLDQVVTGPRVAAQPQRRDGAGSDHEQVLEAPRIGDVLVAGQDQVDPERSSTSSRSPAS